MGIRERDSTIWEATITDLVITGSSTSVSNDAITDWVKNSARAISGYFGKFPVNYARIDIHLGGSGRINDGVTDDDGIRIRVGNRTKLVDLKTTIGARPRDVPPGVPRHG